ncbi:MAG: hypothetical protein JO353_02185 [Phycisphaerae bacterium]|nr:hypothetical protein [Phycisphaerae bacterium]
MSVTYHLSSRQRKELLVRGRPIHLALPAPPTTIDDPVDWAKTVLPGDLRTLVRSARKVQLRVQSGSSSAEGLAGLIGEIAPEGQRFTIGVAAIDVELEPEKPRGAPLQLQWPKEVDFFGRRIPSAAAAEDRIRNAAKLIRETIKEMQADARIDGYQQKDVEEAVAGILRDLYLEN